jgi:acyl-coenzyme A thioesterase PaaI-like protein
VPEPPGSDPLRHHDLCFGCGQANPFGLQLELERRPDGAVEGRFFVKQDHQGQPGFAHAGLLAAALEEALALAAGGPPTRLELDLVADAPVGTFVSVSARAEGEHRFSAVASSEEGRVVARAEGSLDI